ncbi:hypothetical protein XENOCAPTIV_026496 [Xenoophorus captivus]|uniref:Uncharacterized protein n=1 Tax=Xenoophorus captivus TaxID=1517983 RepID=A0ABV0QFS1_9TELE
MTNLGWTNPHRRRQRGLSLLKKTQNIFPYLRHTSCDSKQLAFVKTCFLHIWKSVENVALFTGMSNSSPQGPCPAAFSPKSNTPDPGLNYLLMLSGSAENC